MKLIDYFLCTLLLFAWHQGLVAQKYSNEFLAIGVGAKSQGMGGAFVGGVDDVTAGYWNPAALTGLQSLKGLEIGLMHSEWFAGVGKYDYLGVAGPVANGERILGLTLIRFGIDGIPNTLSLYEDDGSVNYDNITEFSAADYAFFVHYAQPLSEKLSLGGNVKIIHRSIGSFAKAWGFGLDAALLYKTGNWRLGVVARDITSTFNAWSFSLTEAEKKVLSVSENELPENELEITRPRISFGLRYSRQYEKIGWGAELSTDITTDGRRNVLISGDPFSIAPVLGIEGNFRQWVFLRFGFNNFQKEQDLGVDAFWTMQPNLGVGMKFLNFQLDYAFTDVGSLTDRRYSHVISLVFDWRLKREK